MLLGEWSDDEEDEMEERKKIKEALDELSSDEEPEPNFMQDDNIQGNIYEGEQEEEEEEIEEERIEKPVVKAAEQTETKSPASDGSSSEEAGKSAKMNGGNKDTESSAATSDEFEFDINKVLEETSVPSLPTVGDLDVKQRKRKSVSFADKAKEISITTMALVQPASNLEAPFEVPDEFSEFFDPRDMPTTSPKVYSARRILKHLPAEANAEAANAASAATAGVTSSTEEGASAMSSNEASRSIEGTKATQSEEYLHLESETSAPQEIASNVGEMQAVRDAVEVNEAREVSSTDSAFADPTVTQSVHAAAAPLVQQSVDLEQTETAASVQQPPQTSTPSLAIADSTISSAADQLPQSHMHHVVTSGTAIEQNYVDGGQMMTDTLGHLMAAGDAYMQDPNSAGIESGMYAGGHISQTPMQAADQNYMMLVDSATQAASMGHMMYMDSSQLSMVGQTGYSVPQEDMKASSSEHAMPDVAYYQQGHM